MSETALPSQLAAPAGRPIRCVECDLLQYGPAVGDRQSAHCQRCGSPLYKGVRNSVDRTLALLLGALILLIAANTLPFMTFEFKGQSQSNYILSGVLGLWANGYWPLAALICFASILAPMAYILGMLYVIVPVRLGFRPWGAGPFFRVLDGLRPWAMLEVYMFGVFVAVVKLNQLASITPGLGLYAYVALFIVWTAAIAGLDPRVVWAAIGPEPDVDAIRSGAPERMISCKGHRTKKLGLGSTSEYGSYVKPHRGAARDGAISSSTRAPASCHSRSALTRFGIAGRRAQGGPRDSGVMIASYGSSQPAD